MLEVTNSGLYCPAGGFYIDPQDTVENAIVTHGHADHAIQGSGTYHTHSATGDIMDARWPDHSAQINRFSYGEEFYFRDVKVSLHSAGHILGSAQVRIEHNDRVWVVSGDYKRDIDPTTAPWETVTCDTFISESTFALPIFQWAPIEDTINEIANWAEEQWAQKRATVFYSYSLGKTQRLIYELDYAKKFKFVVHSAAIKICDIYRKHGFKLPELVTFEDSMTADDLQNTIIILPPMMQRSKFMRKNSSFAEATTSGWMRLRGNRRRKNVDKGFVLSDHADWPSLIRTIKESQAKKIYTTHGYADILARYCNENLGLDASVLDILRSNTGDL